MNARIDALPTAVADADTEGAVQSWVAARIAFVNAEIVRADDAHGRAGEPVPEPPAP